MSVQRNNHGFAHRCLTDRLQEGNAGRCWEGAHPAGPRLLSSGEPALQLALGWCQGLGLYQAPYTSGQCLLTDKVVWCPGCLHKQCDLWWTSACFLGGWNFSGVARQRLLPDHPPVLFKLRLQWASVGGRLCTQLQCLLFRRGSLAIFHGQHRRPHNPHGVTHNHPLA